MNHIIRGEAEYFKEILSLDGWKRFERLDELWHERASAYQYAYFAHGFRLGAGLVIETLIGGDEQADDHST